MNILMVHSSTLTITTDGEHLTCGGFSLNETVCSRSLEFIIDCFGSVSLSPKENDSGIIFVGETCGGLPSLRTILEDTTDEFYMTPSGRGAPASLSPRGTVWGHHLPPSQPHHGCRTFQPFKP
jgi:hypothetical protein